MRIESFQGLANQHRPERLKPGTLVASKNVILDDTGALETRPGSSFLQGLSAELGTVTDGCAMQHERYGFVLAAGTLYCCDYQTVRPVATGLTDTKLQFANVGDHLLYAGATDAGWVLQGHGFQPLRFPQPTVPAISIVAGDLVAGQYQMATVYRQYGGGLMGSAHPSVSVHVEDGSGIAIQPSPPEGWAADVFITECNGTAEKFLGTSYGGQLVYTGQALSETLDDKHIGTYPLPSRPIIGLALHQLCLHAATYNAPFNNTQIIYSLRGDFHLFRLATATYSVNGRVKQLLGVDEGVLIATDQAVWLWQENGDDAGQMTKLSAYGCPDDLPMTRGSFNTVAIQTDRGILTFSPLNDTARLRFIPDKADSCSTQVVAWDGKLLAIVTLDVNDTSQPYTSYPL